ncbi:MAG: reverse transcriptase/maturase family protein [Cyanobacteriota bacterium]|nr:reverse transcriptase/maturase family protein [Cyanobacteriota bacterium]
MARTPSGASAARGKPFLHNLYPGLTSFSNLFAAAKAAQRGKRWRPDVLAFNSRLESELFQLQRELRCFTYQPGAYRRFMIRDPKPRLISAAPFRDRVVHHALCAVIGPPLERRFLPTTYANRTGYGTHRALRRFIQASRAHRWVLTADIRLYFPSIDHQLLLAQMKAVIACEPTLWLLATILANGAEPAAAIDAFPGDTLLTPLERPRGLPIGNLTSQFLANFHLDRFDHRLRRLSGIGAYLRYVDDFALFAARREDLVRAREVVDQELAALRLRLHPIKSQLRRCGDGASFVGFHIRPGRVRVRNHNLIEGRRRLKGLTEAVRRGRLSAHAARQSVLSWNAHLAHGNTIRLRRHLFAGVAFAAGLPCL